jgi:hypothetical protein
VAWVAEKVAYSSPKVSQNDAPLAHSCRAPKPRLPVSPREQHNAKRMRRLPIIRWGTAAGDGKQCCPHHDHAEADHICMNLKATNRT